MLLVLFLTEENGLISSIKCCEGFLVKTTVGYPYPYPICYARTLTKDVKIKIRILQDI